MSSFQGKEANKLLLVCTMYTDLVVGKCCKTKEEFHTAGVSHTWHH